MLVSGMWFRPESRVGGGARTSGLVVCRRKRAYRDHSTTGAPPWERRRTSRLYTWVKSRRRRVRRFFPIFRCFPEFRRDSCKEVRKWAGRVACITQHVKTNFCEFSERPVWSAKKLVRRFLFGGVFRGCRGRWNLGKKYGSAANGGCYMVVASDGV
jgi:hypothetical protein